MFLELTSEKDVVDCAWWSVVIEESEKISISVYFIKFDVCIFHVSSAFDFDYAGETWWHEVEIEFLFGLIYLLSVAEFSIEMIEELKFAASWSIQVLLIVDSWVTIKKVRDFEISS